MDKCVLSVERPSGTVYMCEWKGMTEIPHPAFCNHSGFSKAPLYSSRNHLDSNYSHTLVWTDSKQVQSYIRPQWWTSAILKLTLVVFFLNTFYWFRFSRLCWFCGNAKSEVQDVLKLFPVVCWLIFCFRSHFQKGSFTYYVVNV